MRTRRRMPTTSGLALAACLATTIPTLVAASQQSRRSASHNNSNTLAVVPSISEVATTPDAELELGQDFIATWTYSDGVTSEQRTTGDIHTFAIELELCGNGAGTCQCVGGARDSLVSLCPEAGCVDSDGSFDLTVPSTLTASESVYYLLRVSLASDSDVFACTAGFKLVEADDGPSFDAHDESTAINGYGTTGSAATLTAFEPEGDLYPGSAFTARWIYRDGEEDSEDLQEEEEENRGAAGDFAVDLYACADEGCTDGSCGTFVAALCHEGGCYDPGTGDYDVVIPSNVEPGPFTLYVEELSENGPWDCVPFDVTVESSGPRALPTPAPTAPLTRSPTLSTPISAPTARSTPAPTTAGPAILPTLSPVIPPTPTPTAAVRMPGDPGMPPTPVPDKQVCDAAKQLSFSYALKEIGGNTVTVEHASGNRTDLGCLTMTMLWEWVVTSPEGVPTDLLYPVNVSTGKAIANARDATDLTGVWLLKTSLDVTNGITLELKGTSVSGGDCNELKISSSEKESYRLRGHGGNLDIFKTKIQSWDETIGGPHEFEIDSDGEQPRSYISCVSEVLNPGDTCESGAAKKDMGECRMDMVDSELGYLGYFGTEAYGITWKVRGFCVDLSNLDLFDKVNVYGDITNCDIHHMWYGMYSYGHQGGVWTNNRMHDNHVYGFDPHDDSDYLTIHNNTVWNNGKHGIIASKRCNHVSVRDNIVDDSGGSGIMLHRSCDHSEVIGNVVYGSADAGLALVETSSTTVTDNVFAEGKWGVRLTLGSSNNEIFDNLFDSNTQREIYAYEGSDEPYVAPYTGINTNNTFDDNQVNYISAGPLNLEDSDGTVISNNVFSGTGGYFEFENSKGTSFTGNSGDIILSDEHRIIGDSCFTASSPFEPTC